MNISSWVRQRLEAKPSLEAENTPLSELEFVLLDTDITGTDITRDSLIGLAALPLIDSAFQPANLLYCRFPRTTTPGPDRPQALATEYEAILDVIAERTIWTINPVFVQHMLEQAARQHRLPIPKVRWMDLSSASRVVGNDLVSSTSLNHWQGRMASGGRHPHDAVYDVFAMAQLLQALLAYAENMGIETLSDLVRNQDAEMWLRPF